MAITTIIFDLDNTIYPVSSIGDKLFKSLFSIIENDGRYQGELSEIKLEIMRTPFQLVAQNFIFNDQLTHKCLNHLNELAYHEEMNPFPDYSLTKNIPIQKLLVTSGFTKLQRSKIEQLKIKEDFDKIFILDLSISNHSKKDVFIDIIEEYQFNIENILVIGDDLNSEIKAAQELGIKSILYDYKNQYTQVKDVNVIHNYNQLRIFL